MALSVTGFMHMPLLTKSNSSAQKPMKFTIAHACENNNSKEAEGRRSVLETKRRHDGCTKGDLQRNSVRLFKISTESRRIVPQTSKNQDGGRCCDPQTNSVRLFKSTITEKRGKILLVQTKRKHDEGTN
ncbi:hypothetical protein V8G54_026213 [Vigna mungo]|uniref:Uncharacterized protein n=1 Tax=Vigna mungo TaxID=3915 RepID=A0AAQ3RLY6_VIGMU